jgi:ABC-2 type transport system permease protein
VTSLTGTGRLLRLVLRRDRLLMPLWVLFLALVPLELLASLKKLFPTAESVAHYADVSAHNSAFTALYGRVYGDSLGPVTVWRAGFIPVVIGLISLLAVVRHTRTEEEAGRRELIGSTAVGRHAGLAAALLGTLAANLVMALLVALVLRGQGLPAGGCLAYGLALAAAGWVFAGVGAVAAQLTSGAGSARGVATGVLGVAYLLRVVGDISGQAGGALSWVAWLSPLGWVERIHPFGFTHWWLFGLVLLCTAALLVAAVALSARRDLGSGLLPARLGPAAAAASLRSPLALAWRLHRGLLAGWGVGFLALGVVMGSVAQSVGDLVRDNPSLANIFTRLGGRTGLIDAYLAGTLNLLGLIASGYAIQAVLRLRAEETAGRAEPVLATAVGRLRWAASHLTFALLGPAAVVMLAALAMGLVHGLNAGDVGHQVPRMLAGGAVQVPAVWVLAALTTALFGLVPRASAASWGALAICLLFGLIGAALQLSHWIIDVSPFTHLPKVPGSAVRAAPLVLLLAIAAVLLAAGLAGTRRRDIA